MSEVISNELGHLRRDSIIIKNQILNVSKMYVQMNIQYLRYVERKENGQRKDIMRALLKYTRAKHDTVRWCS